MTIIGKVGNVLTGGKQATVFIKPASGPVVVNNTFLFDEEIGIPTDPAGAFTVTLSMADYYFRVGPRTVLVSVDNTANTYNLEQKIVGNVVQEPTAPVGSDEPIASQAVFGIVKADASLAAIIAVTGFFYSLDHAAVRLLPNAANNKLAVVSGTDEIYKWSGISTAADDDGAVLKPGDTLVGNPGRWLRMAIGGGGGGGGDLTMKTTIAAMKAAVSSAGIKVVCVTRKESRDYASLYEFRFGDVTAADGFLIIAPDDNGGRYFAIQ